jgi:hypothetical protein
MDLDPRMQSIRQLLRVCSSAMTACAAELGVGERGAAEAVPLDTDVVMVDAVPCDSTLAHVPMPSALLPAFQDGNDTVQDATMRVPVDSRLFPCPVLKVHDMYTSANGSTRLLIHVSHGNVYEVSGHCVHANGVRCERVPLKLHVHCTVATGGERFLIAEYPVDRLPIVPSCHNVPFFQWSAIADTPTFLTGSCDVTRLPSITGYAASGEALMQRDDGDDEQKLEFTLLLKGMAHASIRASQISLVPVRTTALTEPTSAAIKTPEFSVLSIVKAAAASSIKCATAFTVTCLRTAGRVSSMFHVCINGVALGMPPLCVNQVEPARVCARHCLTTDAYVVHLAGKSADGSSLDMFPWLSLLQSVFQYTVSEIMDDGSVVVSFSRSKVDRMLVAAGALRVLFMCGRTCIWTLDPAWAQCSPAEFTPVVSYAPTEWVVSSMDAGSISASVQVFGPDGARILPECCTFAGLIQGGLRKRASPLEPGLSIFANSAYFQLVDGRNALQHTLQHNGMELVQRESAALAKLTWVREALITASIKSAFMSFAIEGTPEQQALLADMVFDNADKVSDSAFVMGIKPNKTPRTYPLCVRGVQIDALFHFEERIIAGVSQLTRLASALYAVVIFGADEEWLVLMSKWGTAYVALEPVHFAAAKPDVKLVCGDRAVTLDVTQVGRMPHRMVCARALKVRGGLGGSTSGQPSVMYNGNAMFTIPWYTAKPGGPGMLAADLARMTCEDLKTTILKKTMDRVQ